MDSTFLGVLAGFGLKLKQPRQSRSGRHSIELLNPNPRITELLETLGVLHLFKVTQGERHAAGESPDPATLPRQTHSREEVTRTCLEAHQLLMEINPGERLPVQGRRPVSGGGFEETEAGKSVGHGVEELRSYGVKECWIVETQTKRECYG